MYNVGIITYDVGHQKANKIILNLLQKKYAITVFAFPFIKKKNKKRKIYFKDRPDVILPSFNLKDFCKSNDIKYIKMNGWEQKDISNFKKKNKIVYLNCISKIIPQNFIEKNIILNAHPGILPICRGVDSFKWSILKKYPIGVTLHVIDKYIDCGLILKRSLVPIVRGDNLGDIAKRSFEIECFLLSNFEDYIEKIKNKLYVNPNTFYHSYRIPQNKDQVINNIFKKSITTFIKLYKKYKKNYY
jgi:methionyl-tRNA formyltransferase